MKLYGCGLEREHPLTFLEFNYMILQSLRFPRVEPMPRRDAADGRVGLGAGNIVAGAGAGYVALDSKHVFGLTTPTRSRRRRAPRWAESVQGAVWLRR